MPVMSMLICRDSKRSQLKQDIATNYTTIMRQHILTFIAILMLPLVIAQAQKPEGFNRRQFSPEQFVKDMTEFITKEAGLSPMEAQAFFPIYFEMQDLQRKNNEARMQLAWTINEHSTEADYERVLEKMNELELKDKQLEKDYLKKFHKILSYKKLYKVKMAAYRYNMVALRRFSPSRRGSGTGNHQRGGWNGFGPNR